MKGNGRVLDNDNSYLKDHHLYCYSEGCSALHHGLSEDILVFLDSVSLLRDVVGNSVEAQNLDPDTLANKMIPDIEVYRDHGAYESLLLIGSVSYDLDRNLLKWVAASRLLWQVCFRIQVQAWFQSPAIFPSSPLTSLQLRTMQPIEGSEKAL